MTQISTPYPATAYLRGFLKKHSPTYEVKQWDVSLETALMLFSQTGLQKIREGISKGDEHSDSVQFFLDAFDDYQSTIEPVIRFLQGKDPTLAYRLAKRTLVPEGPRFIPLSENDQSLKQAFGKLGIQDQAKHIASLYLDDIVDVIREALDPDFEFAKYGEKLAASQIRFDSLWNRLHSNRKTLIETWLEEWVVQKIGEEGAPDLVCLTVPFPGNVLGAFRLAQAFKKYSLGTKVLLGGGYVNTELRELSDVRVFEWIDFITYDDGERPILNILEHLEGKRSEDRLLRTRVKRDGEVAFFSNPKEHDIPFKEAGTPSYEGFRHGDYISMLEMLNPMHRMWSDLRWNKLTLAHGCYWKKCSFCDVTLDYISRFEPIQVDRIIDQMVDIARQTGSTGFHFVDEAAPPALLKQLSKRLLERCLKFTWWGNLRFDPQFDAETAQLMADAGCIAVTGGLEVASDRLLLKMNKGVSIEQVSRVTKAFSQSGILVHAYLMYGFPTQTLEESINSLEVVRKLFEDGCIQSAFWHRFSATEHSPVGKNPAAFGITTTNPREGVECDRIFAVNDLEFNDPTGAAHDLIGLALKKALYNFMHGVGLDFDVRIWFEEQGLLKKPSASKVPGLRRGSFGEKNQKPASAPAQTRRS